MSSTPDETLAQAEARVALEADLILAEVYGRHAFTYGPRKAAEDKNLAPLLKKNPDKDFTCSLLKSWFVGYKKAEAEAKAAEAEALPPITPDELTALKQAIQAFGNLQSEGKVGTYFTTGWAGEQLKNLLERHSK